MGSVKGAPREASAARHQSGPPPGEPGAVARTASSMVAGPGTPSSGEATAG